MLVVVCEQLPVGGEFQFDVVGELHLVAIVLLVDFDDVGTAVVGVHEVGDGKRNDAVGNGIVVAVYHFPVACHVEVNLHTIVEAGFIGIAVEVGVIDRVVDDLSGEVIRTKALAASGNCVVGTVTSCAKVETACMVMQRSAAK